MADASVIFRLLARDETEAGVKSAESHLGGMKSVLGGILGSEAISGVGEFLSSAVSLANQAQKVGQNTAAILASTGDAAHLTADQVQKLAEKYGELAGVESTQVQNGLNTVLRSQGVQRAIGLNVISADQLTSTLTDMSAAMAKGGSTADSFDAASKALGRALADPFNATKALAAVGDPLTASQAKQMAAFKKAGDEAGAYKLVLGSLSAATSGAAAANTTPLDQLKVKWEDVKKEVGQQLIPQIERFAGAAIGAIGPVMAALSKMFGFVTAHANVFVPIIGTIGAVVLALKLAAAAEALVNAVAEANPWVLLGTAIAAIIVALAVKFKGFRDFLAEVFSFIAKTASTVFKFIWDTVSSVITHILDMASHIPFIGDKFKEAANGVRSFTGEVDNAISAVQNFDFVAGSNALFNSLTNMLKMPTYSPPAFNAGAGLGGALGAGLGSAAPKVKSATQTLMDNVMKALQDFKSKLFQNFANMGSVVSAAMTGPPGSNFMLGNLQSQLNKAKQFVTDIATLRKYGLNSTSINELIAAGPDKGADAARELATTGLSSIGQINSVVGQFSSLGNTFANQQASAEFASAKSIAQNKVQLSIDLSGTSNDALVQALRKAIRVKGGNVQAVLGGAA